VRGTYRGLDVHAMPPPSSGGVHLLQMLNIIERYDLGKAGHNSGMAIHVMAEAMRRAYADRSKHLGDPDVVTLPQYFKQHGYHTQALGKIYHGGFDDPQSWSVDTRYPRASMYHKPESRAALERERGRLKEAGNLRRNVVVKKDPKTGKPLKIKIVSQRALGPAWEDPDVPDNELRDGKLADQAIRVMQGVKDQPFFLAVGFFKPHLPFIAPKKYFDLYPPEKIRLPDNPFPPKDVPPLALTNFGEMRRYSDIPTKGPVPDENARLPPR
ncbi:MAG: sulfatase-like hydrolase/transferase, partial [bacterium]|nr:sulfatase-like hydrolase/transferase [bacterium]